MRGIMQVQALVVSSGRGIEEAGGIVQSRATGSRMTAETVGNHVGQIVWLVGARRRPYPNERLRMSAAISVSLLESVMKSPWTS